jgi:hypothetical protein
MCLKALNMNKKMGEPAGNDVKNKVHDPGWSDGVVESRRGL